MQLSKSETNFITIGIEHNLRNDGRKRYDFRDVSIELGLFPQSSGSCKVSSTGHSNILVGVRAAVSDTNIKDTGKVMVTVECSPSVRIYHDKKQVEDLATQYSQLINRTLNGPHGGLDIRSLCIIPEKVAWVININIFVLDWGGNVLDLIWLGVRGALFDTRLPKCIVETVDGAADFSIEGDAETETLIGRELVPISVTISRIGKAQVVDCNAYEELCSSARVTVLANSKGMICGIQKDLDGCLDTSVLVDMVQSGKELVEKRLSEMSSILDLEEKRKLELIGAIGFQ